MGERRSDVLLRTFSMDLSELNQLRHPV